ncbi:MAG: hypothetical protein Q8P67_17735 [archaeon]|nr:hypothetical protein [archaeon]
MSSTEERVSELERAMEKLQRELPQLEVRLEELARMMPAGAREVGAGGDSPRYTYIHGFKVRRRGVGPALPDKGLGLLVGGVLVAVLFGLLLHLVVTASDGSQTPHSDEFDEYAY